MPAAGGPPCSACGRRVAKSAIPLCPSCRRVLCLRCVCPGWQSGPGHPWTERRELAESPKRIWPRKSQRPKWFQE